MRTYRAERANIITYFKAKSTYHAIVICTMLRANKLDECGPTKRVGGQLIRARINVPLC